MPLQNRVDPFGAIRAVPQRGLFMGNRGGKIHDPATRTLLKRTHASRRWIICTCVYKDWHRQVMGYGYTELFFLDEVTALAAGHRPCALCRRDAFKAYRTLSTGVTQSVDELDRHLHTQRLGKKPCCEDLAADELPDGVMVALNKEAFAKMGEAALHWSFDGYAESMPWADLLRQNPVILTPAYTITALKNGYHPVWHPSAPA